MAAANLHRNLERLEDFALALHGWRRVRHAIEFRHPWWFEAEVAACLARQRKPGSFETPEPELQQSGGRSSIRDETMKRILRQHPQRDAPKL